MKIYSYVVARDYGFAPNPFCGYCTLATCKPKIRAVAKIGDWVVGTGSAQYARSGHLVYWMEVCEVLTYDQYWEDRRFHLKRPNLHGSVKQAFGDSIYHHDPATGRWCQEDSHHSYPDGRQNHNNVEHDTQTDRVLVAKTFAYFGAAGPAIPNRLRNHEGYDVCAHRGHKCNFPDRLVAEFKDWVVSLRVFGVVGDPAEFKKLEA